MACSSKTKRAGDSTGASQSKLSKAEAERPENCPVEQPAPALLPGVTEAHRQPGYWFEALGKDFKLDQPLLSSSEIRNLNASMRVPRKGFFPQQDLLEPIDTEAFQNKIDERFVWMQQKLSDGEYKSEAGKDAFQKPDTVSFQPALRVALAETQLYCAPTTTGFYDSDAIGTRINRNTCSAAHAQELIEVQAVWPGSFLLVRTATSWGFIKADAALSPALDPKDALRFAHGPYAVVLAAVSRDGSSLPSHTRAPLSDAKKHKVLVASAKGVGSVVLDSSAYQLSTAAFTRRAVIAKALSYVGMPYGFGGLDGGIDCSRLMLDIMAAFGIDLPRFSGWQAQAGSFHLEVAGLADDKKLALIDKANESGIVLMELPGHIMLYLGRDKAGVPMALHAIAYYLDPCEGGLDSQRDVGQVQIGGLELGRGTKKTSLIERIARVTVLGQPPADELRSLATLRPAAPLRKISASECRKLSSRRLFVSPKRPLTRQPVHVVATSQGERSPATISFFDSKGRRHTSATTATNGPPSAVIGELAKASKGRWLAVLGDGDQPSACTSFNVVNPRPVKPSALEKQAAIDFAQKDAAAAMAASLTSFMPTSEVIDETAHTAPIWTSSREWSSIDEDLFAAFNERLFDYPLDDDLDWPNLYTLLRDPSRNFLYNHFGRDEEKALTFVPDCADLPYTLRAYFAWKLGLPFGVHDCNRARDNRAPTCTLSEGNLMSRLSFKQGNDVDVFKYFVNYHVRRKVHSSSGRTSPDDDLSDFYPVPLDRRSLRPGTLFTDPYGHLLVVVKWVEQGATGYGALIGADAQPDGTVGRRRFWQGSFLFDPSTKGGGSGFKAFRPWKIDKQTKALVTVPNGELRRGPFRFSREQYKGSKSDFYDKMEAIINPRPLDPMDKMLSLVQALEEQTVRRISSVVGGEDFMAQNSATPMVMPEGAKIFLTSGPWEDFATPSRDWRLLVAMHTVIDFPDAVRRSPAQYGIDESELDVQVEILRKAMNKELAARSFKYNRSDKSEFTLSLKDVIDRRVDFEMSYNPNDCVEIRWAAPQGSAEGKTCRRHAPPEQRQRMQELREWFSERRRPAL